MYGIIMINHSSYQYFLPIISCPSNKMSNLIRIIHKIIYIIQLVTWSTNFFIKYTFWQRFWSIQLAAIKPKLPKATTTFL